MKGCRAGSPTLSVIVPATDRRASLERCTRAIETAAEPPEELLVITDPAYGGLSSIRNAGARAATGDVLVFVDSDVEVHPDAFARIRAAFAAAPDLAAVFGSYDDSPGTRGAVAAFRNLLHHHVHQSSPGPASTFWTALGAIRRETFLDLGGFDPRCSSIMDIDLGMRLHERRLPIELDPELLGKHLKEWSLLEMVRTDVLLRGMPWIVLLLRSRHGSSALNLGLRHRVSMLASVALAVALPGRRPAAAALSLSLLLVLNRSFYALLWRRRGPLEAGLGVGLHTLHHATAVAGLPLGAFAYALERCTPRWRAGGAQRGEAHAADEHAGRAGTSAGAGRPQLHR